MKAKAEEKRRLTSFDIYPKVGSERYTITNENQILSEKMDRSSLFYITSLAKFILNQIDEFEFKDRVRGKFGDRIKKIEFKDFEEIGPDIQSIVADQINMAVS